MATSDLHELKVEIHSFRSGFYTEIFRRLDSISDGPQHHIADISVDDFLAVMVMPLKDKGDVLSAEKVDQRDGFLYRHITGTCLGIIGIEKVGVSEDHTVAISAAVLFQKCPEPFGLLISKGSGRCVKRYIQILSFREDNLEPIH